jgi:predicted ester cyclase
MHLRSGKFTNLAGSLRIFSASSRPRGGTVPAEEPKAIVRSFVDAWNERDFDRFDALMAGDAVLHVGGDELPCDPGGTRAIAEAWTTAFPDWRFELLALVAEDDRVVAHMPYTGTFRRPILGIEPTDRRCTVDEIVIFRIADGRVAEA